MEQNEIRKQLNKIDTKLVLEEVKAFAEANPGMPKEQLHDKVRDIVFNHIATQAQINERAYEQELIKEATEALKPFKQPPYEWEELEALKQQVETLTKRLEELEEYAHGFLSQARIRAKINELIEEEVRVASGKWKQNQ